MVIYFIYDPFNDCVKIGYSKNHPEERRLALQGGNPNKIILIGYIPGEKEKEQKIHGELRDEKTSGGSEWFHCNAVTINKVRELLEKEGLYIDMIALALPIHYNLIPAYKLSYFFNDRQLSKIRKVHINGKGVHSVYGYPRQEIEKAIIRTVGHKIFNE